MLLLVYGTLKRGFRNHHVLGKSEFRGEFTVDIPYKMLDLGAYPALVKSPVNHPIFCELYDVPPEQVGLLDRLEGYPCFYTRDEIDTKLAGKVWVYNLSDSYLARPGQLEYLHTLPVVESGVWEKH